MKKFKKILACLIAVMCLSSGLVACDKSDKDADSEQNTINDEVMLNFEQWGPDFQLCRVSLGFGKVSVNKDEKFVKSGKQSCKVQPVGWDPVSSDLTMYFPTVSEVFDYDYSDFSKVERVQIEMYNAEEESKKVTVGLVHTIYDISKIGRTNEIEFTLNPGWNTLYLGIDPMLINLVGRVDDVKGISFMFDKTESSAEPCYYIDEIKLIHKDEAWSTDKFPIELGENEVADFETYYQQYLLHSDYGVKFSIVEASSVGLTAPSGKNILRVEIPQGKNTGLWYNFKFLDVLINASVLGSLTKEQKQTAYFCYDVYNANNVGRNIPCLYVTADGSENKVTDCRMNPQAWYHYSYRMADATEKLGEEFLDEPTIRFDFEDSTDDTMIFYYDNFRVEFR